MGLEFVGGIKHHHAEHDFGRI